MEIPKLKISDLNYKALFFDKMKSGDFFEYISDNYLVNILDIFEKSLDVNSLEIKALDSEYFRLKNEYKYLNFITDVFRKNENKCYVHINFSSIDLDALLTKLNGMDIIDKILFLEQKIYFNKNTTNYFLIDDMNLLKMFLKLILRELIRIELYFPKKPLFLFSNYDMSLPIAFENEKDKIFYKKIATENNLYFR